MFNTAFANLLIKGVLHGTPVDGMFDDDATSPLTKLVLALHTADPGPGGTQETSEVVYPGYARIEVDRLPAKWTVVNNVAQPSARLEWNEMNAAGAEQLATWLTIGYQLAGAGMVILRGRLVPDVQIRLGVIPALKADTTITFVTATPAP